MIDGLKVSEDGATGELTRAALAAVAGRMTPDERAELSRACKAIAAERGGPVLVYSRERIAPVRARGGIELERGRDLAAQLAEGLAAIVGESRGVVGGLAGDGDAHELAGRWGGGTDHATAPAWLASI